MLSLFRVEALDHQRQRLEGDIILTRSVPLWVLTSLLAIITITLGLWVTLGHYRRIETIPGEVLPTGNLSKVFADRPGRILWVGVQEGQRVRKGQAIATIQIEQALADGRSPNAARLISFSNQSRLIKSEIGYENERTINEHRRLSELIAGLGQEHSIIAAQLAFQRQTVESAHETFASVTDLVSKGFITKLAYEQRRQAWLGAAAQLQASVQQLAQLNERRAQAQSDLAKLPSEHAGKIADLENALDQIDQRRIDAEGARGFTITAPASGKVTAVQAIAGRYTDGRLPLLSIVPENATMEVILFAPSRAVGLARAGQAVRLRYDAFPYQRFGSFGGHIVAISRTVLAPDEIDAPVKLQEPVYQLRAKLDGQTVDAFGQSMPLQPGMTLVADIVLDRRSFLDWLLEPIQAVRKRA